MSKEVVLPNGLSSILTVRIGGGRREKDFSARKKEKENFEVAENQATWLDFLMVLDRFSSCSLGANKKVAKPCQVIQQTCKEGCRICERLNKGCGLPGDKRRLETLRAVLAANLELVDKLRPKKLNVWG